VEKKDDTEVQSSQEIVPLPKYNMEGYAEALAFGSPAVVTLLLNMAAFATDITNAEFLVTWVLVTDIVDDAEIPASGETIRNQSKNLFVSLLFRASDKSSDQRPNNAWFRERQAGATVHSTTMGPMSRPSLQTEVRAAYQCRLEGDGGR
jgi:hypothetical protein